MHVTFPLYNSTGLKILQYQGSFLVHVVLISINFQKFGRSRTIINCFLKHTRANSRLDMEATWAVATSCFISSHAQGQAQANFSTLDYRGIWTYPKKPFILNLKKTYAKTWLQTLLYMSYPLIRKCSRTRVHIYLLPREMLRKTWCSLACLIKVEYHVFLVSADPWYHIENTALPHTRKSVETFRKTEC